ncbi:MAG: ATP-binding cassette domain-containing protein [bacterium]|nr:ATP-binding cassette domain-containing protein [bacterium]MCM1373779.1 ATP-binding cassette domain-containing protein [Muribaculum sp.]
MYQYAIDLEAVSYSYGDVEVLRDLSFRVRDGEHVGILGDSGCGKSTLLKILAGLYEPDCGKIVIAGETVPEKIRGRVALVLQHSGLFPLSVRDNISCGHDIPEKTLMAACESACLAGWIASLPQGLDTCVGERGNQVSGGQAQRIQIARAICKDAPVILLDEPISALDRDTGHSVLEALDKLTEGKTVVHVTHHPETLDDSYILYRMEGGRLNRA